MVSRISSAVGTACTGPNEHTIGMANLPCLHSHLSFDLAVFFSFCRVTDASLELCPTSDASHPVLVRVSRLEVAVLDTCKHLGGMCGMRKSVVVIRGCPVAHTHTHIHTKQQ